jgi:choice-of-anchor C domain-containing protein
MFHTSLKRFLIVFIPCLLIIAAMMPLTAFAKSATSDQQHVLTTRAAATITDIVKDGGFEKPALSGGFTEYNAGQTFGKWAVTAGSIDLVTASYWLPAQGTQSVDLDGSNAGTISQSLFTTAGTNYSLSFALAGNPVCGSQVVQMQIVWGSVVVATLSFDTTNHSTSSMGWKHYTYTVQATSATTTLSFVSLTQSLCGPTLDAVAVKG